MSSQNKDSGNRLIAAIREGKVEKVKEIIQSVSSSSINSIKDSDGLPPLCIAADRGHLQIAECLIEHGALVNTTSLKDSYAPLHFAVKRDCKEIAKLFLSSGADVNAKDKYGTTALHIAAEKNFCRTATLLLKYGADPNSALTSTFTNYKRNIMRIGCTPLHLAVKNGYERIVQLLLNYGAVVNTLDENCHCSDTSVGINALHIACQEGHSDIVKILLKSGALVNLKDDKRNTALHCAAKKGSLNVVRILLNSSADTEFKDAFGRTALHIATARGLGEIVKMLIRFEADIECKDACGRTPLHIASKEGHVDIARTLLTHGSDINSITKFNHTPLAFALSDNYSQCSDYNYSNKSCHYSCNMLSSNRDEIAEVLKQQITLRKAANLYVCEKNLQLVANDVQAILFRGICEIEMEILKSVKITHNVTLSDIVTNNLNQVRVYAENKDVVNFLNTYPLYMKFPRYSTLIRSRFEEGVERKELLEQCYDIFYSKFKILSECTEKILSYLNNRDARAFINAFKYGNFSIHKIEELHKSLNRQLI